MDYQVIIPAAGSGKRMGAGYNKLFLELAGRPIIFHTIDVFASDPNCKKIILVIQPADEKWFIERLEKESYMTDIQFALGGMERQYSVYNGLKSASPDGVVLVHDGARPFIGLDTIDELVSVAAKNGSAILAVPVKDTIKKVRGLEVMETIERSSLWQVQTPQAFHFSVLYNAHVRAEAEHFMGTDEASLVERAGFSVKIVQGDYDNIKLTTQEDLYFAEAILKKRQHKKEGRN